MQACELKTLNRTVCNSTDLFTAETPRIDGQGRDHSHECWRCGMTMCNAHVAPQPLQRSGESGQRELAQVCVMCWIEHTAWMRLSSLVRNVEGEASQHDPLRVVLRLEELMDLANDMTVAVRDANRRMREHRWLAGGVASGLVDAGALGALPYRMSNTTADATEQMTVTTAVPRECRNRLIDTAP